MRFHFRGQIAARVAALILAAALGLAALGLTGLGLAERVVATKRTRVYQSPSASARSFAIPAGTVMEMTAEKGSWIRVRRGGITAYIPASDAAAIVGCNSAAGYTSAATPLYKAYGKSAKYGDIPAGTAVTVYAVAGDWALVGCRGRRGFVAKSALTAERPAASAGGGDGVTVTKGLYAYVARDGAKVYKSGSTSSKVLASLPANAKLAVGAVRGDWALVGAKGRRGYMRVSDLSKEPVGAAEVPAEPAPAAPVIRAADWWESDIQTVFARGTTATITDVATGISWREVRKGGTNHADCQPLTAQDTANMKRACGKWSWERRPVVVTIDGVHYAASINCMPHGGGSITGNNFDGHHCIHFINSRTSTGTKPDPDHQAAIKKALALNSKLS